MGKKYHKWILAGAALLLVFIAGFCAFFVSRVENYGYYNDEPFPSADGQSFYILRFLQPNKAPGNPADAFSKIKLLFIDFNSTGSRGKDIAQVELNPMMADIKHAVKNRSLYLMLLQALPPADIDPAKAALPVSYTFQRYNSGGKKIEKKLPQGDFLIDNPANIMLIKGKRKVFNYNPETGEEKPLCQLPGDYSLRETAVITGNDPDSLIFHVEPPSGKSQNYYFNKKWGKMTDLRRFAGKLETGYMPLFVVYDDKILNLFPDSDTPLLLFADSRNLVPEQSPTGNFELSPDGKTLAYGVVRRDPNGGQINEIFIYDLKAGQERMIYREKETGAFLHKLFWFPKENKIIAQFILPYANVPLNADKIVAIDPIKGSAKTVVPPCPAYQWGKNRIYRTITGMKKKIKK